MKNETEGQVEIVTFSKLESLRLSGSFPAVSYPGSVPHIYNDFAGTDSGLQNAGTDPG